MLLIPVSHKLMSAHWPVVAPGQCGCVRKINQFPGCIRSASSSRRLASCGSQLLRQSMQTQYLQQLVVLLCVPVPGNSSHPSSFPTNMLIHPQFLALNNTHCDRRTLIIMSLVSTIHGLLTNVTFLLAGIYFCGPVTSAM